MDLFNKKIIVLKKLSEEIKLEKGGV